MARDDSFINYFTIMCSSKFLPAHPSALLDNSRHQQHLDDIKCLPSLILHTQQVLMEKMDLEPLAIQLKKSGKFTSSTEFVLGSRNWSVAKKLVVFIGGSQPLRNCFSHNNMLGIWSRTLLLREGITSGSMLPYLQQARDEGYGVLILNPTSAPNTTCKPEEVLQATWKQLIFPCRVHEIDFIVYGPSAGNLVTNFIESNLLDFQSRLGGCVFIESSNNCHSTMMMKDRYSIIRSRVIQFATTTNNTPLGTEIPSRSKEFMCLSAGASSAISYPLHGSSNAAYTLHRTQSAVFRFLENPCCYEFARTEQRRHEKMHVIMRTTSHHRIKISDFKILSVVGKGGFGHVVLVKKVGGDFGVGRFYALKVLSKSQMIIRNQVNQIKTERHIQSTIDHPFVAALRFAFQSNSTLYFAMDYYNGGTLSYHLSRNRSFSTSVAAFYAAQIFLAISHLHSKGIIYRDLKLENILVSATDGYVALTDFGLSNNLSPNATTLCGTQEYIAPEVITGEKYGKSVDWWSFGVLLYELISGRTPFVGKSQRQTFYNILNKEVRYDPSVFAPAATSLLRGLLSKNPNTRLSAREIMEHPFFSNTISCWEDIYKKNVPSPLVIKTKGAADVRHVPKEVTRMKEVTTKRTEKEMANVPSNAFHNFSYVDESHLF